MPLYAVGLTEHETPFTFGSSVPPLAFRWSVNKKDVAQLQSVFHKVCVSVITWGSQVSSLCLIARCNAQLAAYWDSSSRITFYLKPRQSHAFRQNISSASASSERVTSYLQRRG